MENLGIILLFYYAYVYRINVTERSISCEKDEWVLTFTGH